MSYFQNFCDDAGVTISVKYGAKGKKPSEWHQKATGYHVTLRYKGRCAHERAANGGRALQSSHGRQHSRLGAQL